MKSSEKQMFGELLTATMEVYGTPITPASIGIWWAALEAHPLAEVRAALSAHVKNVTTGRFSPKPADLLALLQQNDGRPGPEEAWALLPKREGDTAVWTAEMAKAFGVCLDLLDTDTVAARMAFKEGYAKAVQETRDHGEPVKWSVSLGHDIHGREGPIRQAVELGRLPAAHARTLIPDLRISDPVLKLIGKNGGAPQ